MVAVIQLLKEERDVQARLASLDLKMEQIAEIARKAIAQKFNAVSNHPLNSPGTFAYHEGVRSMRDVIADGVIWRKLVDQGIEYIENTNRNIRVIYQNVDYACNSSHDPQPTSKRGGKAKRDAISSNQMSLSGLSKDFSPCNVWVICVSENNGVIDCELSLPTKVTKNGYFTQFSERIFILQNSEVEFQTDSTADVEEYDDSFVISPKDIDHV